MNREEQLLAFLKPYISDHKKELIEEKLGYRTSHITLVLEDIYNPHNANAVVRSCECLGVQHLNVIEERNEYQLSPNVLQGSLKWIDLHRFNSPAGQNIGQCYTELKKKGYRLVATSPKKDSTPIAELDVSKPFALVFGTELDGLSDYALSNSDECVHIPMVGFTESFNISVGAALCMYELMGRLRTSKVDWRLGADEMKRLRLDWYRNSVQRIEILESEFNKMNMHD